MSILMPPILLWFIWNTGAAFSALCRGTRKAFEPRIWMARQKLKAAGLERLLRVSIAAEIGLQAATGRVSHPFWPKG